ncbi:hypothetical protein [Flavobacterium psychrotolerans]|nr:hypothetical protein [Flavobacterium psychrotolerans]
MINVKTLVRPVLVFVFALAFLSCKNNKMEKTEPLKTEDTVAAVAVFMPFKIIMIKHKVADYGKWRKVYDAHDSIRQVYGIEHYVIGKGIEDANMILTVDKFNDLMKAKDFSALPFLKTAMKNAGVVGKPEFSYFDVIRNDDSKIEQKERLMVTHRVKDFDAWLKVYDAEGTAKRMSEGFIDRGMARGIEDPNVVTIVFAITDMKKAKASITSEAKKKLMKEAGVEGSPQLFYYTIEE